MMARRNAATRSAAAAIAASWFSAAAAQRRRGRRPRSHAGDTLPTQRRLQKTRRHGNLQRRRRGVEHTSPRARRRVDPRTWHIARPSKPPVPARRPAPRVRTWRRRRRRRPRRPPRTPRRGLRRDPSVGSAQGGTAVTDDRGSGRRALSEAADPPPTPPSRPSRPSASPSFASIASIVGAPNLRSILRPRVPSRNPLGLSAGGESLTCVRVGVREETPIPARGAHRRRPRRASSPSRAPPPRRSSRRRRRRRMLHVFIAGCPPWSALALAPAPAAR